jgi:hypothetical protein
MGHNINTDYATLMDLFLAGKMSAKEFQVAYLDRFKREDREMSESLYELLQGLFADVDMFSTDPELLEGWPDQYIDETALREKVKHALNQLREGEVESDSDQRPM